LAEFERLLFSWVFRKEISHKQKLL
jgi:hypothetical protein